MLTLVMLFGFLLSFCSSAWAVTYYVDGNRGNNNNPGISKDVALKTIQKASYIMVPGDQCFVLPGIYDERVRITTSGNSNHPILYQADGQVITKGFTIDASYIHIIGFEITDTIDHPTDGTGITVSGSYCEIRSNYIHDVTRAGIFLWAPTRDSENTSHCIISGNQIFRAGQTGVEINGRSHHVENNDISHTLQHPPKLLSSFYGMDADGIRFFGSGHILRGNQIYDITLSDPENVDPHIDCFQTWGPAYQITFEQNFCENLDDGMQGWMIEELESPVQDFLIKNNVVKAFRLLNAFNAEDMVIINNSFKSELFYRLPSGYGIELHRSPNAKIKNNLFYDVGRHEFPYLYADSPSLTGLDVGYNCHFMSDQSPPYGSSYPGDLWQIDPKLVNVLANDFHLQRGSPLINVGITLSEMTDDFDGISRPPGSGNDIGAFNYQSVTISTPQGLRVVQ
jgi:hypothetical protein